MSKANYDKRGKPRSVPPIAREKNERKRMRTSNHEDNANRFFEGFKPRDPTLHSKARQFRVISKNKTLKGVLLGHNNTLF